MELRDKLREEGVRPLIKHREFRLIDPRVVRVIDGPRYRQRALCETVFSTIKRTLSDAVRARSWIRRIQRTRSDVCCLQHQASRNTVKSGSVW
jgi:IS5 family transposase